MTDDHQNASVIATQYAAVREDVTNVAQVCQNLIQQLQTIQNEMRDYVDRKDEKNRGRFLSILSVFVPVVLGLGAGLWTTISTNTQLINDLKDERVAAARLHGKLEAQIEILMEDRNAGKSD